MLMFAMIMFVCAVCTLKLAYRNYNKYYVICGVSSMGDLLPLEEPEDTWLESTACCVTNNSINSPSVLRLNVGGQPLSVYCQTAAARADGSKITRLAQRLLGAKRRSGDGALLEDIIYLSPTDEYFIERPPEDVELVGPYCMSGCISYAMLMH